MSEQAAAVAGQVRRARKASGLTVKGLAAKAGVADGTITRIETGQKVRPGNLRAVLDALGIPPLSETEPASRSEQVQLALDLVEQWLNAQDPEQVPHKVAELTRWIVITNG